EDRNAGKEPANRTTSERRAQGAVRRSVCGSRASAERRRQRRRSRQGSRRAKITIGEAKAIGWKASSNALGRSCGKRCAPPTRGTESARRQSKWNAGQKRPGGLRVFMPKASAREFHQSNRPRLVNALLALRKHSRVLRHRMAFADCFGANPVASALGSSTRRDPSAADRTYHGWSRRPLKTGTFYFARKRNFLLCLDIHFLEPVPGG